MKLVKILNSNYSWFISALILITVLGQVMWFMDKGLMFSDEAFFILQTIPNIEKLGISYWHILYSPFILSNYLYTKYLLVFLTVASAFIMGKAVASYLKLPISSYLIALWCVIVQFILYSPSTITPNYSSINIIIINCLVANLSLFLIYRKNIYLLLVGFFYASLFFVYITSTVIIVPLIIFLALKNRQEIWKQFFWIALGGIVLFVVYFTNFQSPQEFISGILKAIESLKYDKTHNSSGLLNWHLKLLKKVFLPILFSLIFLTNFTRFYWFKIAIWLISGLMVSYMVYHGVTNKYVLFPTTSFYFLALLIVIHSLKGKFSNRFCFAIFLLLVPYCASLGTDVNFFYKSTFYLPFILLACLYMALELKSILSKLLIIGFLGITVISTITFFSYPYRYTWDGTYKPIEQNKEYVFRDSKFYFDSEKIRKLNEAKPYIEGEKYILVSSPRLWGYVLILNGKPPLHHHKFNDYVLQYIQENNIAKHDLMLLEHHDYPFEEKVFGKFEDDGHVLKKIKLSDFDILTFERP
jgi:hypothetical protein